MIHKPNFILLDTSFIINRSISDVFDFVSNHENYTDWYPGVVSVTAKNHMAHGSIGKTYEEILRLPTGRTQNIKIEVVEVNSPDLFVTEGQFPPIHPRMTFKLTAKNAAATHVRWMFESRSQSTLGRFIVNKLMRPAMIKQSSAAVKKLKSLLEQS